MTDSLSGPAIVLALVLAEVAAGGMVVLCATPLWGITRPGFIKLAGAVLAASAWLAWLAARGPLGGGGAAGARGAASWLLLAAAVLASVWQALYWLRFRERSRALAALGAAAGVVALVSLARVPGARHREWIGIFQLLAGALFAGAVTDGLLLGHWYLVERRLTRAPLARMNATFLAGSVLAGAAAGLGRGGGAVASSSLSPLLGAGSLTTALAVGLAALCLVIGVLIRALIREDSIQAATGFFYLAVILALSAEFASKVRFY
jgi:hypothetical protein